MAARNPWLAGSFYLCGIAVIGVLFLVIARTVNVLVLPIVLIASILAISVVGALQLKNDDSLKEKSFLELMGLTFKYLPLLRKRSESEQTATKQKAAGGK